MEQGEQLSRAELFVVNLAAGISGARAKTFLKEYGVRGAFQAVAGVLEDGSDPARTAALLTALNSVLVAEENPLRERLTREAKVKASSEVEQMARMRWETKLSFFVLCGFVLGVALGAFLGYHWQG